MSGSKFYAGAVGGSEVVWVGDSAIPDGNPSVTTYDNQLKFHSHREYMHIAAIQTAPNITVPALSRGSVTYSDGKK
jgi:hypothetical protein